MVLWDKVSVRAALAVAAMLSHFMEVTYSYAYSLYLYFRATWPLSLVYGAPLQPPSLRTHKDVQEVIAQLKLGGDGGGDAVIPMLDVLPSQEDILAITDADDGFDVLQHAVMANRKDVVLRLLRAGCCPNRYHCSPPLQLAAYLGHRGLVEMLLAEGCDPGASRGVCFPEPHLPVGTKASYFGFSQRWLYHCSGPLHALTPLQCAVKQGHLPCVQALTEALLAARPEALRPLAHLQFACKEGAAGCVRYFVDRFPECINCYGPDGDTPLLTAVPWGEECVKVRHLIIIIIIIIL